MYFLQPEFGELKLKSSTKAIEFLEREVLHKTPAQLQDLRTRLQPKVALCVCCTWLC